MLRQPRRLFSVGKQVYDINALPSRGMPGHYHEGSKQSYLRYLSGKGVSDLPPSHFKPLYNPAKALGHFGKERHSGIEISNVGIGSYLGDPTLEDDQKLYTALVKAVNSGINVIDTAANYRYAKSERVVGAALRHLTENEGLDRRDVFLASKIGYLTIDPDLNLTESDIVQQTLAFARGYRGRYEGVVRSVEAEDFIAETHAIHPAYLAYQLERSLSNLQVQTLDLLYLHNAAETRLALVEKQKFFDELSKAFEFMEHVREEGKIRFYGLATWNCFRSMPEEEGVYLSLQEVCELARSVGGEANGFRFVQFPMNIIMHEAFTREWQKVVTDDKRTLLMKSLEAAQHFGINVITSAPLMQTYALQVTIPKASIDLETNAQRHIQLMRSMRAEALKSTLVGFRSPAHIEEMRRLVKQPLMTDDAFMKFAKFLTAE